MYGGRAIDDFDRRVLKTYMDEYMGDFIFDTFQPFHFYHNEAVDYVIPSDGTRDHYLDYIEQLPLSNTPEVFGLHMNAEIGYFTRAAKDMWSQLVELQPQTGESGSGISREEFIGKIASDIQVLYLCLWNSMTPNVVNYMNVYIHVPRPNFLSSSNWMLFERRWEKWLIRLQLCCFRNLRDSTNWSKEWIFPLITCKRWYLSLSLTHSLTHTLSPSLSLSLSLMLYMYICTGSGWWSGDECWTWWSGQVSVQWSDSSHLESACSSYSQISWKLDDTLP